jgi:DNA-binding CsgD family transcriptional regulator
MDCAPSELLSQIPPHDVQLTEKEILILRLMCDEKSTKEIADIVDLSPRTVEAIRDKLKTKTGTKSMAGLVMYAVRPGLWSSLIKIYFILASNT